MRVLFLNNNGGGFADHVEVAEGTSLSTFFERFFPRHNPADYLIRINRQPAAANQALVDNDRITVTPTKVEGAVDPYP